MAFWQHLSPEQVIYALDIFGVAGCAVAGTIQAYRHQLDPLGSLMIAAVSAIGGGTIRDLLLDRHPIFWLTDANFLYVIIPVSLFVQIFFIQFEKIDKILRITDAIGLATFTIIGIEAALSKGMSPLIAIFMGVMTSCFGGVVRDIICNEVPLVLRKEIYISASIAGGLCYFTLQHFHAGQTTVYLLSGTVAFAVRLFGVYNNWDLKPLSRQ
ncbi:MAG: hypothetical protein CR974_01615 [Gammaproteobacteria bacterium]|nr:MAG: hypothetical protein CR974_01615 [Gammaproteobacteria bacterium]